MDHNMYDNCTYMITINPFMSDNKYCVIFLVKMKIVYICVDDSHQTPLIDTNCDSNEDKFIINFDCF